MQDDFNSVADYIDKGMPDLDKAEMTIRDFGLTLERRDDGTLGAKGDFDISGEDVSKLPDLSMVDLDGNYNCRYNLLSSLAGLPRTITGAVDCRDNPNLEVFGDAPDNIKIISDYGTFASKSEMPPELRRTLQEHQGSLESTVMRKPVTVKPALSFRKKP
jgi:hypothetical protein